MKPSLPKGTRDFLPAEVVKRNYMFSVIEEVFKKYGYVPIETPTMESLETLSGKYGEEGDRLLFRILNNGDFLSKADEEALAARDSNRLVPSISKRGLRYDLTVPFARYVVMHRNELPLPFKRYQIQPVWRADRPQRGRYQEFYQCDVDVVGSTSLMYEAEQVRIYDEVFARLGLPVTIRVNHRKVLAGLAQVCGIGDQLTAMTIAIDKLDKIGPDKVREEMLGRGIPAASAQQVLTLLENSDLSALPELLAGSQTGLEGAEDLSGVFALIEARPLTNRCV
ncbi:MAG: HisS family protein, partial [Saprospiraceae bacterium]|nr:HisS family protein [Saprospiraceae bacterium]